MEGDQKRVQEAVQRKRNHDVAFQYDVELIKRVSKNCGSASVIDAPNYARAIKHWSKSRFYVMTVDNAAYCFGSFSNNHFRLAEIAVEKQYQKQGIGKLMLSIVMAECQRRGVHKITLRTSRAERAYKWYLNNGAQVVGINDDDYEMEFIL